MAIKRFIRRLIRTSGWDLSRFDPCSSQWAQLQQLLSHHRIRLVLDVGANIGQYAKGLRDAGFKGRIISFEPVLTAHAKLKKAAQGDALWTVASRMAIGDVRG